MRCQDSKFGPFRGRFCKRLTEATLSVVALGALGVIAVALSSTSQTSLSHSSPSPFSPSLAFALPAETPGTPVPATPTPTPIPVNSFDCGHPPDGGVLTPDGRLCFVVDELPGPPPILVVPIPQPTSPGGVTSVPPVDGLCCKSTDIWVMGGPDSVFCPEGANGPYFPEGTSKPGICCAKGYVPRLDGDTTGPFCIPGKPDVDDFKACAGQVAPHWPLPGRNIPDRPTKPQVDLELAMCCAKAVANRVTDKSLPEADKAKACGTCCDQGTPEYLEVKATQADIMAGNERPSVNPACKAECITFAGAILINNK